MWYAYVQRAVRSHLSITQKRAVSAVVASCSVLFRVCVCSLVTTTIQAFCPTTLFEEILLDFAEKNRPKLRCGVI